MSELTVQDRESRQSGKRLREVRERLGLSLEDAAQTTRISKTYLKALEDGALDKLPSEAYAKGFRRSYARYLGLSEEEVQDKDAKCTVSCLQDESAVDSPEVPCCSTLARRTRTVREAVLPFMALVAIAALSVLFFVPSEKTPETPTVNQVSVPPVPQQAETASKPKDAVLSQSEATDTLEQTKEEPVPAPPPDIREGGLVLTLKAIEDGTLDVTIDNTVSQHYDLKTGDIIEWKGEKFITLDLENAGGVEARLNGKLLKPFGEVGVRAHAVLTADERIE